MDFGPLLTPAAVLSVINFLTAIISKLPFSRREKKAIAAAAERLVHVASMEDVLRYDPKASLLGRFPAKKKRSPLKKVPRTPPAKRARGLPRRSPDSKK
jgi:hypothetical protein